MKSHQTATRIIAGVLPAMALFATPTLATPAFAQDTINTTTTPPPAPASTSPAPDTTDTAPVASPNSADQARYQASLDAATHRGATADGDAPAAAAPARAATRRIVSAPSRAVTAPAAPAVATPVPAVQSVAPAPAPVETTAPADSAPTGQPAATSSQVSTTETGGTPAWMWLVAALAGIGVVLLGVLALRRRQSRDAWAEAEPVYAAEAPLAYDEPIVEHADVVTAEADDVAAMTDAAAPVAGRPWIELSLRPVRAGATDESALVDLELTLANAGAVTARDVRVSTFMLGDATDAPTDMERLLATGHSGTEVDAGAIDAGEGSRIDARVAIPRDEMERATFQPLVGVDVRYTLPDGSEGRTAAAFAVGVHDDTDTPTPLRLGGDMREDVEATLHGVPERV